MAVLERQITRVPWAVIYNIYTPIKQRMRVRCNEYVRHPVLNSCLLHARAYLTFREIRNAARCNWRQLSTPAWAAILGGNIYGDIPHPWDWSQAKECWWMYYFRYIVPLEMVVSDTSGLLLREVWMSRDHQPTCRQRTCSVREVLNVANRTRLAYALIELMILVHSSDLALYSFIKCSICSS